MSEVEDIPLNKKKDEPKLIRAVSRWEIVGISINDVIGSGIYLLPAAAAALLGVVSIGAILLAGIAVGILVLCFAEAASHFDEPGGAYIYTREAFGQFVGFEVGWMTWLARVASVAALSAGFVEALSFVWPGITDGWTRIVAIILLLLLLGWINVIGVKEGARFAVGLTIVKLLPLILFAVAGLFFVDWGSLSNAALPSADSIGKAALLLLFAYAGFENSPALAGEYKNPKKDVPFAILTMIVIITTLYVIIQLVAVGTFPGLPGSDSPLADSALQFLGTWGALMMTIAAVISIGGNISNTTLIGPRYLFALAKDGYGPAGLANVHPKYKTPAAAIITQTVIALLLALSGTFVQLALLSLIARMFTYIGTVIAVPVLRRKFGVSEQTFTLWGGYTIPIIALIICIVLLASTTLFNIIAGVIGLAVGALVYYFWGPDRTKMKKFTD
jgi:amino acid transporter